MKKILLLSIVCAIGLLFMIAPLSQTSAQQSQQPPACIPACPTFSVPLVTHGIEVSGDHFLLSDQLGFTVVSPADAGVQSFPVGGADIGGINNTIARGLSIFTPNKTVTALSCLENLWDINFAIRTSGATDGDRINVFVQNPDGSNKIVVATFTVQNGGLFVSNLDSRVRLFLGDRFAVNGQQGNGSFIPLNNNGSGFQSGLLTIPFSAALMNCSLAGFEITRASGMGTTAVVISDIVVTRNRDLIGTGSGISTGRTSTFPAGKTCDEFCPSCPTPTPTPGVCGECRGGLLSLTLRYTGSSAANVQVTTKKGDLLFNGNVAAGGTFTINGAERDGKIGTDIFLKVNGSSNASIHTSCSRPIGPGLVSGAFEVVSGRSKDGGELCPIPPTSPNSCGECQGKVTSLTLQYTGSTAATIQVTQKDGSVINVGTVQPNGIFTIVGTQTTGGGPGGGPGGGKKPPTGTTSSATLGVEITIQVNGQVNTSIHTSCSQPLGPGLVRGAFRVISGASRDGGTLCPL